MEELKLPGTLSEAVISSLPATAYYIPNFITSAEEIALLNKINTAPPHSWHHLSHRRLQTYPSPLSPQNSLLAADLPVWLAEPIIPRLLSLLGLDESASQNHIFSHAPHAGPNHVLVNEYTRGQGIFPHEDGGAYYPLVATVSLGSHGVLDVYPKKADGSGEREREPRWRILQEPRSLLITNQGLYRDYLHGIAERGFDDGLNRGGVVNWDLVGSQADYADGVRERGTRVSLTFRDVIKVKNLGKGLRFLGRNAV